MGGLRSRDRKPPILVGMEQSYANPVIDADWPDPDAIRVGDDYIMVASSFGRTPGLPILRSSNLVDWRIVGHAVAELEPRGHFTLPRPGAGVGAWAPSIRFHDGTYYVVVPDPDHGVFVTTATDPAGPWATPRLLFAARGVIDPCPLWDDDGRAWLVHGWAESRCEIGNRLDLLEVSPDLSEVLSPRRTLIDGDEIDGCHTLEGPKIYRDRGWYWIFAPAGGVATGWQYAFRATSLDGPWEHRIVMSQGDTAINGPHQGAWVTTAGGEDWFLHFQDRGPYGRVTHLQPMSWTHDGWPVIGEPDATGTEGHPVTVSRTPDHLPRTIDRPATSDDFRHAQLGLQWTFPAIPPSDALELRGDGRVRLAYLPNDHGDVRALPQALTQPIPGQASTTRVTLVADPHAVGRAGLLVLGAQSAWIGLERAFDGEQMLVCRRTAPRATETQLADPVPFAGDRVDLAVAVDANGGATFRWRGEGDWSDSSEVFPITAGRWVGAELALFAAAPFGARQKPGAARFSGFAVVETVS